jgi:outer membrane cobalamin receptor
MISGSIIRKLILPTIFLTLVSTGSAQVEQRPLLGVVTGRVADSEHREPIEYAEILLYRERDNTLFTGMITDEVGRFNLTEIPPGLYLLEIRFIGYREETIENIVIRRDHTNVDLGTILMEQTVLLLEGEEVVADKPSFEYRLDKKVINVARQPTTPSGTAVDVLENVPSVTVDIEGNVLLRGSANFSVFIDGRPSLLEPSEALQQLPASSIETIEIITNPSAKYDPDSTSGIINIIMKKGGRRGSGGILTMNAGLDEKYGGDILLNLQKGSYDIFLGADYNRRSYPGSARQENETNLEDTTSFVHSTGKSDRKRTAFGLRGEVGFTPGASDHFNLGFRYGGRASEREADLDYNEWTDPPTENLVYRSRNRSERSGDFYSSHVDYKHSFAGKGHEISGQFIFSHRQADEETTDELFEQSGIQADGRRSTEKGPSDRLRTKLDYTQPLSESARVEAGYQSRIDRTADITRMFELDPSLGEYLIQQDFSRNTEYNRDIHSIYGIYSDKLGRFGYQGGLRGEITDRLIKVSGEDDQFTINRWDWFPSFHMSTQFNGGKQLIASYARRIERPRGWYLEPFETWTDAFNVRRGNPDLKPESIDSYELGFQTDIVKGSFSTEAYYRISRNKIERVRSVYDENVTLHSLENVGTDYSFGTEVTLYLDLLRWWDLHISGNLYNYRVEGELYGDTFDRESFNWNGRLNNELKIGQSTKIQFVNRFFSSTVTSQGSFEGFYSSNLVVRQDLFDRALTASVQVSDIFDTARHEFSSTGTDFFSFGSFKRNAPQFVFTLSYNFNDYKPKRTRDRDRENGEDEEEF